VHKVGKKGETPGVVAVNRVHMVMEHLEKSWNKNKKSLFPVLENILREK